MTTTEQTPVRTPATIARLEANTRAVQALEAGVLESCVRLTAVEARLGKVEAGMTEYQNAAKAVIARHPVTARQIVAVAGLVTAIGGIVVPWINTREVTAEARAQAKVSTEQTYARSAERERDDAIARAVSAQAEADRVAWTARVERARIEGDERAAKAAAGAKKRGR